jgi:hypothetical protein
MAASSLLLAWRFALLAKLCAPLDDQQENTILPVDCQQECYSRAGRVAEGSQNAICCPTHFDIGDFAA